MPPVFTIMNHGTDSHRTRDDGEIVTIFGDHLWALWDDGRGRGHNEYRNYLICDGPGSTPNGDVKNPMPGHFDPQTLDKKPRKMITTSSSLSSVLHPHPTKLGLMKGTGWEDNVDHAMAVLWDLQQQGEFPATINMLGWSRGAVTCFRMANEIQSRFAYLNPRINIFAIDPVAGLSNKGYEINSVIPACVDNLIITLANNERRFGFEPQDLDRIRFAGRTNYIFLPFPGKHNTQVRGHVGQEDVDYGIRDLSNYDDIMTLPAQIVWSLAYTFLSGHGTLFHQKRIRYMKRERRELEDFSESSMKTRTPEQYLALYERLRYYTPLYEKYLTTHVTSDKLKGGGVKQRRYTKRHNIGRYVRHPYFFVNEHHRWCYRQVHGPTFENQLGDPRQLDPRNHFGGGLRLEIPCRPCEIEIQDGQWNALFPRLRPKRSGRHGWIRNVIVSSYQGRAEGRGKIRELTRGDVLPMEYATLPPPPPRRLPPPPRRVINGLPVIPSRPSGPPGRRPRHR